MREQNLDISTLVAEQFPDFYHRDGPKFVQFVKAYYEWMEEANGITDLATNIYNLRDIDETVDEFVIYFREKYLVNFDPTTAVDARMLVKHAAELFGTKGTEQSIKLLFQLVYNQEINLYYPGDHVIRASDGKWFVPKYLEVSTSEKNASFLYREVRGSSSGAKAFVEGVVRKTIDTRVVDVLFLSNVRGTFIAGERITQDGSLESCPVVLGSLINIDIIDGGANNTVGDILTVYGGAGKGAKARVAATEAQTGRVSFTLNDGGSGYRLTSNVMVSDLIFEVDGLTSVSFEDFEVVNQENQRVGYVSPTGNAVAYATVVGYNSSNVVVANGSIMESNATTVTINVESGNFSNADSLRTTGNTFTAVTANTTNVYANGIFIGYAATTDQVGLFNSNGTFYANALVHWATSNTYASIVNIKTGVGADFSIGSLTNDEAVVVWSDLTGANNSANVPFLTLYLSGNNSGLANGYYGFPKLPAANIDSTIISALNFETVTLGTISSLSGISPGEEYNTDVLIAVYEPLVAPFDLRDKILEINNSVGTFLPEEEIQQSISVSGYTIQITYISGTFSNTEGVTQTSSGAQGQIRAVNSTHIIVTSINEVPFVIGQQITGLTSTAVANAQSNVANPTLSFAKGIVRSANTSVVTIKPTSINTSFDLRFGLVGATSNATANVFHIYDDNNSRPMGYNADVTGRAVTANGVISSIAMIDSGFGFINNEELLLESEGNPVVASGFANVNASGTGQGFWKNTDGMLNSDKYIHDNDYYQSYAYEIQTGIPLSNYSALLKASFHMAGTKLFGKVVKVSQVDAPISTSSSITTS